MRTAVGVILRQKTLAQRIKALFARGEQGAWFDPNDMATLWQDSAGTTPVTALEQPVGLMLDKSGRGASVSQATSTKRPTYSARVNLLLDTNTLATQNVTTAAIPYTLKHDGSGTITLSGTSTAGPLVGAGTLTFTPTAGTLTLTVSGSVTNAQLQTGSTATRYQWVNTATDYDSAGFMRYLKFDGVDDAMATAAIDFSGTDKMTVCAGLRKLVGAGFQDSVELGTGADSGFSVHAPTSAADDYGLYMTGAANNFARCGVFAKPITNVVTAILDRGGATAAAQVAGRVNGASVSFTGGGVATAGSFVNGPLYIGARAGTSLYFNGHFYGGIIRGAQSSASQIADMERYINQRTGAGF